MQCIVFFPDSRQAKPKLLWQTITDTWNVSMAPAAGRALAKNCCVFENVLLVDQRVLLHNRK